MNSQLIDGVTINVSYSHNNKTKKNGPIYHGDITIKNISPSVTQKELIRYFEPFGSINSFKIPTKNGEAYGVAYIQYSSNKDAMKAISEMNGKKIDGQIIKVIKHLPKSRNNETNINLFIKSGLPLQIKTKEDLIDWLNDTFSKEGNPNDNLSSKINKTILLLQPNDEENREAILTFSNFRYLKNAMNILKLHGVKCHPESDRQKIQQLNKIKSCWNNSKDKKYSNSIYIRNFPNNFTEKDLEREFWTYQDYRKTVLKEADDGYSYAFIGFKSQKSTIKALENSCLIYFENEENESSKKWGNITQLFASLRSKNKGKINEKDKHKIDQIKKNIVSKFGKNSINFHRFIHLSASQKICLFENDKLLKKWNDQCSSLASKYTVNEEESVEIEEEDEDDDNFDENEKIEIDDDDDDFDENSEENDDDDDSDVDKNDDDDDDFDNDVNNEDVDDSDDDLD